MDSTLFLAAELIRLLQLERDIRASGPVAEAGWAIDTSGKFARVRPQRVKGKLLDKTITLGQVRVRSIVTGSGEYSGAMLYRK